MKKYFKDFNKKFIMLDSFDDKVKRHELEAVMFNRDIINGYIKQNIEELRNKLK